MSSKSRKTRFTANAQAKVTQPAKAQSQPPKATTSAPLKPAPAPVKATVSPPAKLTPSARLRQEWESFESWLSLRRAEKDKRMNEKLKEIMASKGKSRNMSSASGSIDTDAGAFEDKLNEELAEQARDEWLRRLEVAGLDEQEWVDISPAEMEAVEVAFTPQKRSTRTQPMPQPQPQPQHPSPSAPAQTSSDKSAVNSKPAKNPRAARVEDVPLPPGAWNTPSKTPVPGVGIIGRDRDRPEIPMIPRNTSVSSVSGISPAEIKVVHSRIASKWQ